MFRLRLHLPKASDKVG